MTNVNCDTFLFFFIIILMFLHVYDQVSRNCLKLGPTPTLPPSPPPPKKKLGNNPIICIFIQEH